MYPDIPGYQILRHIGRGSQSDVFLATQQSLDRQVAVKVMISDQHDPKFRSMFLREARTIGQLHHPNVVTIHDIGEFEQGYFIVMEYAEGGTLIDHMRRGLSEARIVEILRQMARALSYIHARDIIHRDVKSTNILFRNEEEAVLSDFGIAKSNIAATALTAIEGAAIGTPGYMSPEQERGLSLDARSDLYSLGVVFHKMLLSYYLHQVKQPTSGGGSGDDQLPPRLPVELEKFQPLIDGLLQRDRDYRFSDAKALLEAIDQVAQCAPLSHQIESSGPTIIATSRWASTPGRTAGMTATLPPPKRSRRWLTLALAAGVAGVLVAAGLLLSSGWQSSIARIDPPPTAPEEPLANLAANAEAPRVTAPDSSTPPSRAAEEAVAPGNGAVAMIDDLEPPPPERREPAPLPAIELEVSYHYQPHDLDYFIPFYQNDTLRSGDRYKVKFKASQQSYIYVFQADSRQILHCLFPRECAGAGFADAMDENNTNPVRPEIEYTVPGTDRSFMLDDAVGEEQIYVLAFRQRNYALEAKYKEFVEAFRQRQPARASVLWHDLQRYLYEDGLAQVPPLSFQHARRWDNE